MENSEWIQNAIHYMKSEYGQAGLSLPDVTVHAGFSMDYFNRLFASHTGFTVMAYLSYWRLKEAARRLCHTEDSVLDIALAVGYDSHEGFLPFDDLQHGDFAETHGHFTAVDMGFEIVNWKYKVKRRENA